MSLRSMVGLFLAGCLVIWGTTTPRVTAEDKAVPPVPQMAYIDIEQILQKDGRYQQALQQIKADSGKGIRQYLDEIEQLEKNLAGFKARLPPEGFNKAHADFILEKHKLLGKIDLLKAEQQFQRTDLERQFYQQIQAITKEIAEKNNIVFVFNTHPATANMNDEMQVQRAVHQPLVYARPELEITVLVLGALQQKHGVPQIKEQPDSRFETGLGLER